jgi:flagellin-specific chaperone FliS
MEKEQKIKYTNHYLNKLEDIFAESDYMLRYEKGNFKSGYCLLKDTRIAIVNKFFPIEGKINSLIDIIKEIDIDPEDLSDKNKKLYRQLQQTVF